MAWTDLEIRLGREGSLKVGQHSLGKRTARAHAQKEERQGELGTGELLNRAGAKATGKW